MLRERRSTIGKMIDRLADLPPKELGGFRIEISLVAKTLGEAKQKALRLPFFKLENWLHPTDQRMVPFKLQAIVVTKKDLIDNVTPMLAINCKCKGRMGWIQLWQGVQFPEGRCILDL